MLSSVSSLRGYSNAKCLFTIKSVKKDSALFCFLSEIAVDNNEEEEVELVLLYSELKGILRMPLLKGSILNLICNILHNYFLSCLSSLNNFYMYTRNFNNAILIRHYKKLLNVFKNSNKYFLFSLNF
jgi:hypothetical protein